jgi:hypothetical protein
VSDDTKALIATAKAKLAQADFSPFKGPVMDQSGKVITGFEDGKVPDYATIESLTTLVQGIVGQIPKS